LKVHELYVTVKSKISSQLKLDKDALNKIVESLKKEFPSTSIFDLNGEMIDHSFKIMLMIFHWIKGFLEKF